MTKTKGVWLRKVRLQDGQNGQLTRMLSQPAWSVFSFNPSQICRRVSGLAEWTWCLGNLPQESRVSHEGSEEALSQASEA